MHARKLSDKAKKKKKKQGDKSKLYSNIIYLPTSKHCLHIVVATHWVCWGVVVLSICEDGL